MSTDKPTNPKNSHLFNFEPSDFAEFLEVFGEPKYRAAQLIQWIYERGVRSFDEMSNLSKSLRQNLQNESLLYSSEEVRRAASEDGTVKLLVRWPDQTTSECVMIPTDTHKTACISSQVGCPVGCRFCASGLDGLQRNLTAGEIVEQAMLARREAEAAGGRLSNIVFMGLGEPFANYDNVVRAIRTINADWGMNIGARKITVSTVGVPKGIRKLADEGLQLNLALSLHAPDDDLRAELIPWAERITIKELIDACRYYFQQTGREITLEYTLLAGVNDTPAQATKLAHFVQKVRCNVNLLRYNPVDTLPYERPKANDAFMFQKRLKSLGVNAHLRKSRGRDIDAACGQLRRREMQGDGAAAGVSLPLLDG